MSRPRRVAPLPECHKPGCTKPAKVHSGLCHTHYSRRLREVGPVGRTPLRDRLLSRVVIDPDSDHILWTGPRNRGGYGRISVDGRFVGVHRVMYEMFAGPIPDGLHIDHLCRVTNCVNVAHLEAVTNAENMRRQRRHQREMRAASHV